MRRYTSAGRGSRTRSFTPRGPRRSKAYIDGAIDVLDRKLQMMEEHDHFRGIEHTRTAIDRLLPTLRAVQDPVLRDIYVARKSRS